jgi:hypothetical protein
MLYSLLITGGELFTLREATLASLIVAASVITILYVYFFRGAYSKKDEAERERIEREIAVLEETRNRIRHEYEAYENLLIARSRELALGIGKTEDKDRSFKESPHAE